MSFFGLLISNEVQILFKSTIANKLLIVVPSICIVSLPFSHVILHSATWSVNTRHCIIDYSSLDQIFGEDGAVENQYSRFQCNLLQLAHMIVIFNNITQHSFIVAVASCFFKLILYYSKADNFSVRLLLMYSVSFFYYFPAGVLVNVSVGVFDTLHKLLSILML